MREVRVKLASFGAGMFSALNHAVAHWWVGGQKDYCPHFDWRESPYSENGEDAWDYYFIRNSASANIAHAVQQPRETHISDHPITPRGPKQKPPPGADVDTPGLVPLLPPAKWALSQLKATIRENLVINGNILRKVFDLCHDVPRPIIGMHIRGPKRVHGGTGLMLRELGWNAPPYEQYFNAVESLASRFPGHVVWLATDSGEVADRVLKRYPGCTYMLEAFRPPKGEPHLNKKGSPRNKGEQVLLDMLMLSMCDAVVHGNSNLTNFLQAYHPAQTRVDIFEHYYKEKGWLT